MEQHQDTFEATRDALHRIAVHVVARARQQATGRFSLRVTPGGFGTPEFGEQLRRVRIAGGMLVVESDAEGDAVGRARRLDGASLRELAELASVDLDAPLDVGHDTPDLGDPASPIAVDPDAARRLGEWYGLANAVLDTVIADVTAPSTLPRLWPEHFDVAIEVDAHPDRRVNLGASPGDGFCAAPYFYVGPWTDDRPGAAGFWNAPFGAYLPAPELGDDRAGAALAFLCEGIDRLA